SSPPPRASSGGPGARRPCRSTPMTPRPRRAPGKSWPRAWRGGRLDSVCARAYLSPMPMIDLSFPIRPHFRWTVAREIRASHANGDNFESSVMTLGCHAYTHVDAPRHFLPDYPHIAEMSLDQWVGDAAVVDLTHLGENAGVTAADLEGRGGHVRAGDIVLL